MQTPRIDYFLDIGVGNGAAGAAPIFCQVAVLGPRFFFRYASCLFYNPDIEILRARFARGCFNSFIVNNLEFCELKNLSLIM